MTLPTNHVRCAYKLITDNLMDLSHVGFVHTTTIGDVAFGAKGKLTVTRRENGVSATRLVPDVPPPPLYIKSGQLPEDKNIDRWSTIEFIAPCFVIIHKCGAEVGTGALDGDYSKDLNLWVMNAMTPETPTSTNYFWGSVRRHAIDDPAVDQLFFKGVSEAFKEDRVGLKAQQAVLAKQGDSWAIALKGDMARIQSRRVFDQLLADENRSVAASANMAAELASPTA